MRRRAWLAAIAGGAVARVGDALGQTAPATPLPPRKPWPQDKPTPPLALPSWDGPAVRLAELKGHVVVLNFWASWCEPCRTEMPSLELMAQRHEADGLLVLAVNHRETDAAIRRYLALWPITLPILRDADGATSSAWQVRAFPTTFVVGRQGRVLFSVAGEVDWNSPAARDWIREALAHGAALPPNVRT